MPCEFDSTMLTTRDRCAEFAASCSDVAAMLKRVEMSTRGTAGVGTAAAAAAAAAAALGLTKPAAALLRAAPAPVNVAAALIPASTAESFTASSSRLGCTLLVLLLFAPMLPPPPLLLLGAPVMMVPLQVTVPTRKSPTGMLRASEYASAKVSRYASILCKKQQHKQQQKATAEHRCNWLRASE
jgi:hypothetical protein